MPHRSYGSTANYRFGFNGKENDNESKGLGNQQDYGMRIYDVRLGRFLSVDPLAPRFPMLTPYQYASNNPIFNIDIDGLEGRPWYTYDEKWNRAYLEQSPKAWKGFFKGLGNRAVSTLDFITTWNPWNVSEEGMIDKGHQIEAGRQAIANPGQTLNNIKSAFKQWANNLMSSNPEVAGDAVAGGVMGLVDLYGGYKAVSSLTKLTLAGGKIVYKTFSTASIRFSQTSINGLEEIVINMKANGWKGDPIDIVKMQDKIYTTVDNTRLAAAQLAGIDVKAVAHNFDDLIPEEVATRFADKKGNLPKTWGEAVKNRIANQNKSFRTSNENGTFVAPVEGSTQKQ